jgi:two-component system, NtrC family, response regulator HydG
MARFSALIVEDDAGLRDSLGLLVSREGYDVRYAADRSQAQRMLAEAPADVVLLDIGLPDGDGIELLRDQELAARCDFIVMTGNASVETAVQALRVGTLDYLTKPVDRDRLRTLLAAVARTRQYRAEARGLRDELRQLGRFGRLVGRSPAMHRVFDLIERVAPTEAGVLLTGESGTGKELAAETIHLLSRRRSGAFLGVNSSAVSSTLIESELFGHEKGSFTGADARRRGYFEEASGGTLFLDEITDMPMDLQAKLLRVLETSAVLRVGASDTVPVDVRVVAATNRDAARAVRDGKLREDLYYRLNVFPIAMPPLRDRSEDVELLADHFLDRVNARDKTTKRWSPEAIEKLISHNWPGNVRELKNAVERAAILADSVIGPDLIAITGGRSKPSGPGQGSVLHVPVGSSLEETERRLILATLAELNGDKRRTAETLGIGLKTLYTRLSIYEAAGRGIGQPGATAD